MNLDELKALADAALVIDPIEVPGWYTAKTIEYEPAFYPKNARFIAAADPGTIKQLIELCEMQHEALAEAVKCIALYSHPGVKLATEALATFEHFGKE
jgi:hypothetical protein